MSTHYVLRKAITLRELTEKTGWRMVKSSEGENVLTDGSNYAHPDYDGEFVTGFERFGQNDVRGLVDVLDCVSEHDEGYDGDWVTIH